ncbi:MAG: dihydrofolate reductase family protein [Aquificaceae bacterium]|nr:dihydrofolate reductase family protein [Aquificaceae bacterium]
MRLRVCIVSGVTLDGKISLARGISSKETMHLPLGVRVYLHRLRSEFDAISVGCNTVRTDNPYLKVQYVEGKDPIRVVPCSKADVSPDSNVFSEPEKSILVTTSSVPQERLEVFRSKGIQVLIAGKERIDLERMLTLLAQRGIKSLMVEGGSRLNGNLLSRGLVDELVLIHHPIVVGLVEAPSLAEWSGLPPVRLSLVSLEVVEGYPVSRWLCLRSQSVAGHRLEYSYAHYTKHGGGKGVHTEYFGEDRSIRGV